MSDLLQAAKCAKAVVGDARLNIQTALKGMPLTAEKENILLTQITNLLAAERRLNGAIAEASA